MFANDGVECRRLLSDGGVPVSIDEMIERRDLVVHVRSWNSVSSAKRPASAAGKSGSEARAHPVPSVGRDSWYLALPIIRPGHLAQNPVGIAEVELFASIDSRLRFREIAL